MHFENQRGSCFANDICIYDMHREKCMSANGKVTKAALFDLYVVLPVESFKFYISTTRRTLL